MKFYKTSILLLAGMLFISISCNKNNTEIPEEPDETNFSNLLVGDNFNWSTTHEISIKIHTKDNQGNPFKNVIVKVYTDFPENGGLLMATGSTGNNGYFELKRPVSSDYESLVFATEYVGLVNFIEVPIINGTAEHTFGGSYVPNKSGGSIPFKNITSVNSEIAYLGTYNNKGVPNYLVSPDDAIPADFLNDITNSLPEGQNVTNHHPEYLSSEYEHDLLLECESTVWVTFVHEGAGYKNVLGFYTYDMDSPPQTAEDIDTITIIFPNTSYQGSGGGLHSGNKVNIGTFPGNTGIGWVLISDGWRNGSITDGYNYLYSAPQLNPESDPELQKHCVLLHDPGRELTVLGWEDIQRDNQGPDPYNCDHDFNDVLYYITTNPIPCTILDFPVIDYSSSDSDGDGVPDNFDDYADNPDYAFNNYYPCDIAHGSIAFEDLWPGTGDYDFNDLVVDYNFNQITNGENKIVKINSELILKAQGAAFENGFGFSFDVDPSAVTGITGQDLQESYISTNANGTEAGQSKAVVIAFDNSYNLLPYPGNGIGVNTTPSAPYVDPDTLNIEVMFDQPYSPSDVGTPPFNPFLIVNKLRGYEVHLPDQPPTDLFDANLFGTQHDDSQPLNGRYYKTENNLPWAIDIWFEFAYPVEKTQITAAHLKFADWAQSDGNNFTDWYEDQAGYRNESNIYVIP